MFEEMMKQKLERLENLKPEDFKNIKIDAEDLKMLKKEISVVIGITETTKKEKPVYNFNGKNFVSIEAIEKFIKTEIENKSIERDILPIIKIFFQK